MNSKVQFKLVITKDGKEEYSSNLSYDAVNNIVSSALDFEDNNDLFLLASQHPAASVREAVAYKENLSNEVVEILSQDKSIPVLRSLVRSNAFKNLASQELIERLISLDVEIAQNVANSYESYQDADPAKLIEIFTNHEDPSVVISLVQNYSLPKKVIKSFLDYPDQNIAMEAKMRLENN